MTKDFQQLDLTAANLTDNLVSDPGYVEISGTPDSASLAITLTNDPINGPNDVLISLPVQFPGFTNPVNSAAITAGIAIFVPAHRLTFTLAGGAGSEDVTVRWYPVHQPY